MKRKVLLLIAILVLPRGVYLAIDSYTNEEETIIINEPVAVSKLNAGAFNIFPNPGKGKFILENKQNENIKFISITDISGKNILQLTKNINLYTEIDITKQNSGIYILSVQTDANIYRFSIVKE